MTTDSAASAQHADDFGRAELADFEPTTSHRHGCQAFSSGCACIDELFAIAEDASIEAANARRAVAWVVESSGGRVVVPRTVMQRDWLLTAEDTIDGGRRFISAPQTGASQATLSEGGEG